MTASRPSPRLGVSPLSWVNEVLEDLGGGAAADVVLAEAAAAGFDGVEMSRIFPRDPAGLSALLARHGLAFVSGWHSGFLADRDVAGELEAVREHATLLRDAGASVMVYGECGSMVANALDVPGTILIALSIWRASCSMTFRSGPRTLTPTGVRMPVASM